MTSAFSRYADRRPPIGTMYRQFRALDSGLDAGAEVFLAECAISDTRDSAYRESFVKHVRTPFIKQQWRWSDEQMDILLRDRHSKDR